MKMIDLVEAQTIANTWTKKCFGAQATNKEVRALRLAEESIEFAQAVGVDPDKLHKLIDYIFDRPCGDASQELGGVGLTFLTAASAMDCDAGVVIELEIERVLSKSPDYFTERNQRKCDLGFK
jgi:NTP pyrophosphatase (non-canonical NTP hydrolase)